MAIPVILDANLGDKSTELTKCPEGKAPENRLPVMYKLTTTTGLSMKDNVSSIIMYMYWAEIDVKIEFFYIGFTYIKLGINVCC